MGPAHLTNKSLAEIQALYDRVIACAPDAIVTEQIGAGRDGRTWFSEESRRALKSGDRWLIVTISRDIDERRRHEQLQALQHAVTRELAQTGSRRSVLQAVLVGLGPALGLQRALCTIAGTEAHDPPSRLASWQHDDVPPGSGPADAIALARAHGATPDQVVQFDDGDGPGYVVPLRADGKTLGALMLQGDALPGLQQIEHVLVAIGDQLGQYIRAQASRAGGAAQRAALSQPGGAVVRLVLGSRSPACASASVVATWATVNDAQALGSGVGDPTVRESENGWAELRGCLERHESFRDFEYAYTDRRGKRRHICASGEPLLRRRRALRRLPRRVARRHDRARRPRRASSTWPSHDSLTGLPNRVMFGELLNHVLAASKRNQRQFAVLFIDLDRFKFINDSLGHEAGDTLLREVATRLKDSLRASDIVARLGGDEFVMLLQDLRGIEQAGRIARKLLSAVIKPLVTLGQECRVTASIGISVYPNDAHDETSLMTHADIAMYHAKEEGKNNFQFYDGRAGDAVARAAHAGDAPASCDRAQRAVAALPGQARSRERRASPASRPCCAGTAPSSARCRRPSSSRWPRRPG